MAYVIDYELSW